MAMAGDGVVSGRRGYPDRSDLVGIAAFAVPVVSESSNMVGADRRGDRDGAGVCSALLEVRDEHDRAGDADRAA